MADAKADVKLQEQLLTQLLNMPPNNINNIEKILGQFIRMPRATLSTWGGLPQLVMAAQFTCYLKGHGALEEELTSDTSNMAFSSMLNAVSLAPAKTREG